MFKTVLLYTNELESLKRFYRNILELDIPESSNGQFTVKVGESVIRFIQSHHPAFYHFAINIPGNQFSMMKYWLQDRVELNREEGRDEIYFSKFDADSMYFEDPTGNVVEFIGRRHRDLFGDLSPSSFLSVSEVGITTPFVAEVSEQLQDFGIALRSGTEVNPESVDFLGGEDTFIVLVRPNRRWYFSKKYSEIHPLEITLNNGSHIVLDDKGNIRLSRRLKGNS